MGKEIEARDRSKRKAKDEVKEKEKDLGEGRKQQDSELKKTKMGILASLH